MNQNWAFVAAILAVALFDRASCTSLDPYSAFRSKMMPETELRGGSGVSTSCFVDRVSALDPDCLAAVSSPGLALVGPSQEDIDTAYSVVCDPDCGNALFDAFEDCGILGGNSRSTLLLLRGQCGVNDNREACYRIFSASYTHLLQVEPGCYERSVSNDTCSCRDELVAAVEDFGCCLSVYHNFLISFFAENDNTTNGTATFPHSTGDSPYRPYYLYNELCSAGLPTECAYSLLDGVPTGCPVLPPIPYGFVNVSGFMPGHVAVYFCDEGFLLVGDPIRVCLNDSTWDGDVPICKPACPDLSPPPNGVVVISGHSDGDTANFSCDSGYELFGEATLHCWEGSWSYRPPICLALCPELSHPPNGAVELFVREGRRRGPIRRAFFTCDYGYGLVGIQTLTCLRNGTWTAEPPVCKQVCNTCPVPVECDSCCPVITCPTPPPCPTVDCPACPPIVCPTCPTFPPTPTPSVTTPPPTTPPPVPANVGGVRSPECGMLTWGAVDGDVTYKVRFFSGRSWDSTPKKERKALATETNSLYFTAEDVPTGRPLFSRVKARNSDGVHSPDWSLLIVAAESDCP